MCCLHACWTDLLFEQPVAPLYRSAIYATGCFFSFPLFVQAGIPSVEISEPVWSARRVLSLRLVSSFHVRGQCHCFNNSAGAACTWDMLHTTAGRMLPNEHKYLFSVPHHAFTPVRTCTAMFRYRRRRTSVGWPNTGSWTCRAGSWISSWPPWLSEVKKINIIMWLILSMLPLYHKSARLSLDGCNINSNRDVRFKKEKNNGSSYYISMFRFFFFLK